MGGNIIKSVEFPEGKKFEVVVHDLLKEETDAIVNAANSHLVHGGGVAAAISSAAGTALDEEGYRIVAQNGPVPVGEGVVTTAGKLPFKGVIHVVGPRCHRFYPVADQAGPFRGAAAEGGRCRTGLRWGLV